MTSQIPSVGARNTVQFRITRNISHSKGWGRYKAQNAAGPIVQSSTDNEWVSAPHSGSVSTGTEFSVTLQTMERVGKYHKETINIEQYKLVSDPGARAELGYWNGFQLVVEGARLAQ